MTWKKVLLLLGISVFMLSSGVQSTYGTNDAGTTMEEDESALNEDDSAGTSSGSAQSGSASTGSQSDSDAGKSQESSDSSQSSSDDGDKEVSKDSENKENKGEESSNQKDQDDADDSSENPDGAEQDPSDDSEGQSGDGEDQSGEDQSTEDQEQSGDGEDQSDESEDSAGQDESSSEEGDGQSAEDSVAEAKQVNMNAELTQEILDYASYGDFTPSAHFVSWADRVKYNTDVPIDGIPSFITQEMITGALSCQDEYGVPASVTVAQIIAESGYGRYGQGGSSGQGLSYLAYEYNNLFGIKGTGNAGSVQMRTGEQHADGSRYTITAGFRVYNTYTESIEDHAKLLSEKYSDLTAGVTDANTYAMRISKRYATSLNYGKTLIHLMTKYNLYRLDEMTLEDFDDLIGSFADPCPGAVVSSGYGNRKAPTTGASTYHKGLDMATGGRNLPTYAAEEGTVTFAGYSPSGGNMIIIDHGKGLVTKYMHHAEIYVKAGDHVEKGQQIGLAGSTGISTGIHLHFQVEENGVAVDPTSYLSE